MVGRDPGEVHHFTTIKGHKVVTNLTKVRVIGKRPHPGIVEVTAVPLGPAAVYVPVPQMEGVLS